MKHLLLLLVVFVFGFSFGQLSEESRVYLLTCDVGDEIYEQFGHSAIRIEDPINGIDNCYNWGMFEFGEDEFEFNMKFAKGSLDYFMAVEPTEYFLYPYQMTKRQVVQQELNLSLELKNQLWGLLIENAKPENRYYRYDFFFDNCATRISQFLKLMLKDKIKFAELPDETNQTFRQIIDKGFLDFPWTDFGIDLVLGYKIDVQVTNEDIMFSPIYMEEIFEESQIETANGLQNLVLSREVIVPGIERNDETDAIFTPLVLAIVVLAITVLLSFFKLNVLFKVWSSILFLLLGILGILLLFMWFGTDHIATKGNLNLIWANPLLILMIVIIWSKKLNAIIGKTYLILAFIMFGLILFFMMLPQEFNEASRVLIINLALQFYVLHKMNLSLQKKD
jgi:hypothetical protein